MGSSSRPEDGPEGWEEASGACAQGRPSRDPRCERDFLGSEVGRPGCARAAPSSRPGPRSRASGLGSAVAPTPPTGSAQGGRQAPGARGVLASPPSGDTDGAAPGASQGPSGSAGGGLLAALRERRESPGASAQAPPRRARGTGSPAVGPGPERSCPRTLAREAGGSGREGSPGWGWGGARSRREQNVEISRRQTWEPRRRAQLAGDTGFPGEKAGRTEVRTFSLSPIPHPARGGASSTHVSGKERKFQIAPHPLVSDGQPGPVALKLGVKSPVFLLLPPTPFPPPCLIGQRFSSKAVAANEWAGDGDALRRWGESWPSKGHVRMYWRRRGEWGGQEAGAHSSVSPEPAEIGAHKG
ncbi:uncharacterized protein LOC144308964 [Canis aureus]